MSKQSLTLTSDETSSTSSKTIKYLRVANAYSKPGDGGVSISTTVNAFLDHCSSSASYTNIPVEVGNVAFDQYKLAGPGFILCNFKENATTKTLSDLSENSSTRIIVYDVDDINRDELDKQVDKLKKYNVAIYSTAKHTTDKPRVRILIALNRPLYHSDRFIPTVHAVAKFLGIPYDTNARDKVRLFFFGQQIKDNETMKLRFHGKDFNIDDFIIRTDVELNKHVDTTQHRRVTCTPDMFKDLLDTTRKQRKHGVLSSYGVNNDIIIDMLSCIKKSQPYTKKGSRSADTNMLCGYIARVWPSIDFTKFATDFLEPTWRAMPTRERTPSTFPLGYVDKFAARCNHYLIKDIAHQKEEATKQITQKLKGETEFKSRSLPDGVEGNELVTIGSSIYVYDYIRRTYSFSVSVTQLPTLFHRNWRHNPFVETTYINKQGREVERSVTDIRKEHEKICSGISYHAVPTPFFNEEDTNLHLPVYTVNSYKPVYHEIADDLITMIGGSDKTAFEEYLYLFRDLSVALPLLVLEGPGSAWKTKIGEMLSKYWLSSNQVDPFVALLANWNDSLLDSPVFHIDEGLPKRMDVAMASKIRSYITDGTHTINIKREKPIQLNAFIRMIYTTNNAQGIISSESGRDSVEALAGRISVFQIKEEARRAFVDKWVGTKELRAMEDVKHPEFLEHIEWLRANRDFKFGVGRLNVHLGQVALINKDVITSSPRTQLLIQDIVDHNLDSNTTYNTASFFVDDENVDKLKVYINIKRFQPYRLSMPSMHSSGDKSTKNKALMTRDLVDAGIFLKVKDVERVCKGRKVFDKILQQYVEAIDEEDWLLLLEAGKRFYKQLRKQSKQRNRATAPNVTHI